MKQSETISKLLVALLGFQSEVKGIAKDTNNPFFKSKYADLDSILDEIDPLLTKHGLVIMQHPTGEYGLTTILAHAESGEYIESEYSIKPSKDDPQGNGGRITYQRRYAIAAILKLSTEEDDDGNKASEKPKKKIDFREAMSEQSMKMAIDNIERGHDPKEIYKMADKKYKLTENQKDILNSFIKIEQPKEDKKTDSDNYPF